MVVREHHTHALLRPIVALAHHRQCCRQCGRARDTVLRAGRAEPSGSTSELSAGSAGSRHHDARHIVQLQHGCTASCACAAHQHAACRLGRFPGPHLAWVLQRALERALANGARRDRRDRRCRLEMQKLTGPGARLEVPAALLLPLIPVIPLQLIRSEPVLMRPVLLRRAFQPRSLGLPMTALASNTQRQGQGVRSSGGTFGCSRPTSADPGPACCWHAAAHTRGSDPPSTPSGPLGNNRSELAAMPGGAAYKNSQTKLFSSTSKALETATRLSLRDHDDDV